MAKKIFVGNYKGGVGKTTTVFEIGALLAEKHEKKVLLIDLDPQCSLSKVCGKISDINLSNLKIEETFNFDIELYGEYINRATKLDILEDTIVTNFDKIKNSIKNIKKYSENGGRLDFIPTVLDMKNGRLNDIAERLSKNKASIISVSKIFSDITKNEDHKYDYILFDCPPTSNTIIQGVFLYSDYYLIPTIGDEISSDGVADYIREIEGTYLKYAFSEEVGGLVLKKYFGQNSSLIGVLRTMYKDRKGNNNNLQILENIDNSISSLGIKSIISQSNYAMKVKSHIFDTEIKHLDNRTNMKNYGLPITVSNGDIHTEYEEITRVLKVLLKG